MQIPFAKGLTWQGQGSTIYAMKSTGELTYRVPKICSLAGNSLGTLANFSPTFKRGAQCLPNFVAA